MFEHLKAYLVRLVGYRICFAIYEDPLDRARFVPSAPNAHECGRLQPHAYPTYIGPIA